MTTIAVIANSKKILGRGLDELRQVLAERGVVEPLWYEATNSREAATLARSAVDAGADLLFLWGGDGTIQRCVDALAGDAVDLAILPAGTANLLATNLGIPIKMSEAVDIGLYGDRRRLDVGVLNGKKFAVMAGVGFDAVMMEHADAKLKHRIGRLAYVVSGLRAIRVDARDASIYVDEELWFTGKATCVLLGQMGSLANGIVVFPDNSPDDGLLDVGVVTAKNTRQWARVLAWLVAGKAQHSPFTHMTKGAKVDIKLDRATLYELDGGARKTKKLHRASIVPGAINVCVPNVATD